MQNRAAILAITFLESFGTICVERGIFFYAHKHLGFSDAANLWLALTFGVAYVAGAMVSHPVCERAGERKVLRLLLAALVGVHVFLAWGGLDPVLLFAGNVVCGVLCGAKWPVIESYVNAGLGPREQVRQIGRFNLSWASAVPFSLVACGPMNVFWPQGLFLLPAAINLVSMAMTGALVSRPEHLEMTDPLRPSARTLDRYRVLLTAGRWLLLMSYSCMWLVAALGPLILARLAVPDAWAPGLAAVMDATRFVSFLAFQVLPFWIGRRGFLVAATGGLVLGFFLVLSGASLTVFTLGNVLFGVSAGGIYYAALYYAMVVKNASVDAGGKHEGLIGLGFTTGPAACLVGILISPLVDSRLVGSFLGIAPLILVCVTGAFRTLWRLPQDRPEG
jgi:hypothetical protein